MAGRHQLEGAAVVGRGQRHQGIVVARLERRLASGARGVELEDDRCGLLGHAGWKAWSVWRKHRTPPGR